jgi:plasmid replication initiation protein
MKEREQIIVQHNSITEARYEMTSLEKNILYFLVSQIRKEDINSNKKFYKISINDLSSSTNKVLNHIHFKLLAKKMLARTLSLQFKGKFYEVNLISSSEYLKKEGCLEIELSEEVSNLLFDLKTNFTTLHLKSALSLKSKYSKRIYEMLSQYKDTKIFRISIDELKWRLSLKDFGTGLDKYEKFSWFKKKVLDIAEREINSKCDIGFTYKSIKTGRKYTNLEFIMNKASDHGIKSLSCSSVNEEDRAKRTKEDLINNFGLSDWQVKRIFDNLDIDKIGKTKYDIHLERINGRVRNIGAYTAKVFDQKYKLGLLGGDVTQS